MKRNRLVIIASMVVSTFILYVGVSYMLENAEFVITPKNWGFSVRRAHIGAVFENGGLKYWFTNRVSQIGPIKCTEFNCSE